MMLSTRLRIAVFFTALVVFIIALIMGAILYFSHISWMGLEKDELYRLIGAVEKEVTTQEIHESEDTGDDSEERLDDDNDNGSGIDARLRDFFNESSRALTYFRYYDENGREIFASEEFPTSLSSEKSDPVFFSEGKNDFLVISSSFSQSGGVLQIAIDVTRLSDLERLFLKIGFIILAVSSLVIFVAGYSFSWHILAPIREITEKSRKITVQNLSERLPVKGPKNDEIRELSEDLNEMFARIERSVLSLKQFTHDASHELRTPIAALDTTLQLVERTHNISKIGEAKEEIQKMNELISSLLQLARYEDTLFDEKQKSEFRLSKEVNKIMDTIGSHFSEKKITREMTIPQDSTIRVEPVSFRQVIWNLVWNAYKFSGKNGKVEISFNKNVLRIADNGTGIATKDIPHLFDRFFRGDKSRSTDGFGLGLAIAKRFAEANGFRISVRNRKSGGAEFSVGL